MTVAGDRRSNVVAGALIAVGGGFLAISSTQAWITISGPTFGVSLFKSILQVSLTPTLSQGAEGQERAFLLALAAIVGLLGLFLVATTVPFLGVLWRLGALLAAALPAVVCLQVWQASGWTLEQAVEDPAAGPVPQFLAHLASSAVSTVFSIGPAEGLYEMTAGIALVAVGLVVPSRRTSHLPSPATDPVTAVRATDHYATVVAPNAGSAPTAAQPMASFVPVPAAVDKRRFSRTQVMATLGGAIVLLTLVWIVGNARTSSSVSYGGLGSGTETFDDAERSCITSTEASSRDLFEQAMVAWQKDSGPLNLDGNPAYSTYGDAVADLDMSACPQSYKTTYASWAGAWREYGSYLKEMSKPHAPWNDEWSKATIAARRAEYNSRVRMAYDDIRTAAMSGGVDLPTLDWTPRT